MEGINYEPQTTDPSKHYEFRFANNQNEVIAYKEKDKPWVFNKPPEEAFEILSQQLSKLSWRATSGTIVTGKQIFLKLIDEVKDEAERNMLTTDQALHILVSKVNQYL